MKQPDGDRERLRRCKSTRAKTVPSVRSAAALCLFLVRPPGARAPKLESAAVPRSTRSMTEGTLDLAGGCTCRAVRYRMTRAPLIVHCCHCRWCQRETGSAFVLNALVEAEHVTLTDGQVDVVHT